MRDIYSYIEVKKGGIWKHINAKKAPLSYHDSNKKSWEIPRDYDLFSFFSGVCPGIVPYNEGPRDVPKDLSDIVRKKYYEAYYKYNPSYYLLSELLILKDKKVKTSMIVSLDGYVDIKKNGFTFLLETDPNKNEFISNDMMDRYSNLLSFWEKNNYITSIEFEFPINKICPYFWNDIVPKMQELDDDPNNVRIVFWFSV